MDFSSFLRTIFSNNRTIVDHLLGGGRVRLFCFIFSKFFGKNILLTISWHFEVGHAGNQAAAEH